MFKQIAGIIGWIGVAIVAFAVGIKLEIYLPGWVPYINYLLAAALVCILVYMLGEWQDIMAFFRKRQARYGTMSLVSILVGLGIVVAINYLAVRQNKRWDLTENQAYTLSEQTIKVLKSLDAPVQFSVYDLDTNFGRFKDRLDSYAYESKNVNIEYVDIDRQPARAKQAQIQTAGTIVLSYKDRTQKVTNTDEQDITNALIKLQNPQQKKVYFTQGHGERDTAGSDRLGYATVAAAIGRDNFTVEKLVLAQQKTVPADATVIIIAGPKTDFLEPEITALKAFLARGGKLMVMLDPPEPNGPDLTNIRALLKDWSIEFGNDIVVDASGMGQLFGGDASVPVAASYPAHPITDNFRVMTAFPLSRSVKASEGGTSGKTPQMLVETSAQSWAETDLKGLASGNVEFNGDKGDKQGPIALGAAVSAPASEPPPPASGNATPDAPKPESRIVAFGDSDFAANNAIGIQGNQDFFLNSVNWLAQQENQIAIRAKEPTDRRVTLTASQQQRIWLLSIFIIPGLVLGAGAYTWWRRR
jgi:gliding motility-associatede transport system auxiliary component